MVRRDFRITKAMVADVDRLREDAVVGMRSDEPRTQWYREAVEMALDAMDDGYELPDVVLPRKAEKMSTLITLPKALYDRAWRVGKRMNEGTARDGMPSDVSRLFRRCIQWRINFENGGGDE